MKNLSAQILLKERHIFQSHNFAGNFPMYGTKVKQDTVILYAYSKNTALNSSF